MGPSVAWFYEGHSPKLETGRWCWPLVSQLPRPLNSHGPIADRLTTIANFQYRRLNGNWLSAFCIEFLIRCGIHASKILKTFLKALLLWVEYVNLCWLHLNTDRFLQQSYQPVMPQ